MADGREPLVLLKGITKRFPHGVTANRTVDLALYGGEIHALVGENGAGKTTLMNVLFGLAEPDEGQIVVGGRLARHRTPADAIANGIGMVHQHFKLVPRLTVAENLILGRFRETGFRFAPRRVAAEVNELSRTYGLDVEPGAIVGSLPLAAQQRVEILKALYQDARVLILDEPTTVLIPEEVERLYDVLAGLAREGRSIVLITHHLEEVFRFSDFVSVLRLGRLVGSGRTADMSREEIAELIIGREFETGGDLRRETGAQLGPMLLELDGVSLPGSTFSTGLDDVTLEVRGGEVLAVAGVEGNGQRELFEIIAGLRRPARGRLAIGRQGGHPRSRHHSAELGLRVVPEDRHSEGLVLDLTVAENLVVDRVGSRPYAKFGWLNLKAIRLLAAALLDRFDIRASSAGATARTLSGGNQQKVVLARALRDGSEVLLAHRPTRGLDVGATEEILQQISSAAEAGAAVLFISSSLEEVLRMGDRIIVFYRGRIAGETSGRNASVEQIGRWMTGVRSDSAA